MKFSEWHKKRMETLVDVPGQWSEWYDEKIPEGPKKSLDTLIDKYIKEHPPEIDYKKLLEDALRVHNNSPHVRSFHAGNRKIAISDKDISSAETAMYGFELCLAVQSDLGMQVGPRLSDFADTMEELEVKKQKAYTQLYHSLVFAGFDEFHRHYEARKSNELLKEYEKPLLPSP